MSRVDTILGAYPDSAPSTKVLKLVFSTIPGSPPYDASWRVEHFVRALNPGATDAQVARAKELAETDRTIGEILWMGKTLDSADKGIAVMGGLMNAFKFLSGKGAGSALETDPQQAADAAIKALGVAYMAAKAFPGTVQERAAQVQQSVAGRALIWYYAAMEVGLPFADNLAQWGADGFNRLVGGRLGEQQARLAGMAPGVDLGEAAGLVSQLSGQLQTVASTASQYVQPLTQQVSQYLPGAANFADKAAGGVATMVDLLDVYTVLSARLAAETAARRALTS
jgi:hypothetical protein